MYTTVLRIGLWTLILVLILFVMSAAFSDQPFVDMIPQRMLAQALVVAGVLIAAGLVLKVLDKGKTVVAKNRCRICRTAVVPGALYCREHLRTILYEEDDKAHSTGTRRT